MGALERWGGEGREEAGGGGRGGSVSAPGLRVCPPGFPGSPDRAGLEGVVALSSPRPPQMVRRWPVPSVAVCGGSLQV